MKKTGFIALFALAIAIIFSSCAANSQITMSNSIKGEMEFHSVLEDFMVKPLTEDLSDFAIEFDFSQTQAKLEADPNIENVDIVKSDDTSRIDGSFSFSDIRKALTESDNLKGSDIVTTSQKGLNQVIEIKLNRDNFDFLVEKFNLEENYAFLMFDPRDQEEDEYFNFLHYWITGYEIEEELNQEILDKLKGFALNLTFKVNGKIISQTGGETLDTQTVKFKVPILDIILQDQEKKYTVTYR